jgi:two-component system phosphate regulon sensor histidine kinase PhoR
VFQNLIDNAIKYGRPGSSVRVAAWLAERGAGAVDDPLPPRMRGAAAVAIAVMDEGDGIAREHLTRLTERFYRVDKARSRDLGGTGLGLAIVKHILNRHRAALEIDSERAGSTLRCTPMARSRAEPTGREIVRTLGKLPGGRCLAYFRW